MTTKEAISKYNGLTGNSFTQDQLSVNLYHKVEGQANASQQLQFRLFCCENGVEDTGFGDIASLRNLCNIAKDWLNRNRNTYCDKERGILAIAMEGDKVGKEMIKNFMTKQNIVSDIEKYFKKMGYTF